MLKAVKADLQQGPGGDVDQLHLGVGALVPQDVDVALDELPQAALLGALGTEHPVGLDHLEGGGQDVPVGGIVAGERQGQVIPQAHVGQGIVLAGVEGGGQLVPPLEHLEDQAQVFAAVGFVQVFQVLQHGGGNPLETGGAVHFQNLALDVIPQGLFSGQKIPHPF